MQLYLRSRHNGVNPWDGVCEKGHWPFPFSRASCSLWERALRPERQRPKICTAEADLGSQVRMKPTRLDGNILIFPLLWIFDKTKCAIYAKSRFRQRSRPLLYTPITYWKSFSLLTLTLLLNRKSSTTTQHLIQIYVSSIKASAELPMTFKTFPLHHSFPNRVAGYI